MPLPEDRIQWPEDRIQWWVGFSSAVYDTEVSNTLQITLFLIMKQAAYEECRLLGSEAVWLL
jgi:hypothetical protein